MDQCARGVVVAQQGRPLAIANPDASPSETRILRAGVLTYHRTCNEAPSPAPLGARIRNAPEPGDTMTSQVLIRGGLLVDGTGAEPREADEIGRAHV